MLRPMTPPQPPVAVLVPIKGFSSAKARLAGVVQAAERARLAREMALRVLRAADPLPVWVVCDDAEVSAWADANGAQVAWCPADGLNPAVAAGAGVLAAQGFERAIVAHADLPRARTLAHLADGEPTSVLIVPDRHRDGTNVLVVPLTVGFRFRYGPGSFQAHVDEAHRLGLATVVVDDDELAWDVDVPDDLPAVASILEGDET